MAPKKKVKKNWNFTSRWNWGDASYLEIVISVERLPNLKLLKMIEQIHTNFVIKYNAGVKMKSLKFHFGVGLGWRQFFKNRNSCRTVNVTFLKIIVQIRINGVLNYGGVQIMNLQYFTTSRAYNIIYYNIIEVPTFIIPTLPTVLVRFRKFSTDTF